MLKDETLILDSSFPPFLWQLVIGRFHCFSYVDFLQHFLRIRIFYCIYETFILHFYACSSLLLVAYCQRVLNVLQRTRLSGRLMIWLLSLPLPPSLPSAVVAFFSLPVEQTDGRRRAGGGRSQIIRRRKSLVFYIPFTTLCLVPTQYPSFLLPENPKTNSFFHLSKNITF
jgi:hypothetical protein